LDNTTSSERATLTQATQRFVEANNAVNLEVVMAFFSDDAVYEDIYGGSHIGKVEIRQALAPFFDGSFGKIEYVGEDLFVDADSSKIMIRWRCDMHLNGVSTSLRGLDLLHFREGKIIAKLAYSKAKEALFQS
jgi:ketosteroid isomerase-like protein